MMTVQQRLRAKVRRIGSPPVLHKAMRTGAAWCNATGKPDGRMKVTKPWHRANCEACAKAAGFRDLAHAREASRGRMQG